MRYQKAFLFIQTGRIAADAAILARFWRGILQRVNRAT